MFWKGAILYELPYSHSGAGGDDLDGGGISFAGGQEEECRMCVEELFKLFSKFRGEKAVGNRFYKSPVD